MERQFEKAVQGASTRIDGCDTRWCQDDVFFLDGGRDVAHKRGFTRARLSRKEERATGKLYNLECLLHLLVL